MTRSLSLNNHICINHHHHQKDFLVLTPIFTTIFTIIIIVYIRWSIRLRSSFVVIDLDSRRHYHHHCLHHDHDHHHAGQDVGQCKVRQGGGAPTETLSLSQQQRPPLPALLAFDHDDDHHHGDQEKGDDDHHHGDQENDHGDDDHHHDQHGADNNDDDDKMPFNIFETKDLNSGIFGTKYSILGLFWLILQFLRPTLHQLRLELNVISNMNMNACDRKGSRSCRGEYFHC